MGKPEKRAENPLFLHSDNAYWEFVLYLSASVGYYAVLKITIWQGLI